MADGAGCGVCGAQTAPRLVGGAQLRVCRGCGLGQLVQGPGGRGHDQDQDHQGATWAALAGLPLLGSELRAVGVAP